MKTYYTHSPIEPSSVPQFDDNHIINITNYDVPNWNEDCQIEAWGKITYEQAIDRKTVEQWELFDPTWENKANIVYCFGLTLKKTRIGKTIEKIWYEENSQNEEYVWIKYKTGGMKRVCVTADSGIAIMKDILRAL